jgi:hypothetical protein
MPPLRRFQRRPARTATAIYAAEASLMTIFPRRYITYRARRGRLRSYEWRGKGCVRRSGVRGDREGRNENRYKSSHVPPQIRTGQPCRSAFLEADVTDRVDCVRGVCYVSVIFGRVIVRKDCRGGVVLPTFLRAVTAFLLLECRGVGRVSRRVVMLCVAFPPPVHERNMYVAPPRLCGVGAPMLRVIPTTPSTEPPA